MKIKISHSSLVVNEEYKRTGHPPREVVINFEIIDDREREIVDKKIIATSFGGSKEYLTTTLKFLDIGVFLENIVCPTLTYNRIKGSYILIIPTNIFGSLESIRVAAKKYLSEYSVDDIPDAVAAHNKALSDLSDELSSYDYN
jgi:hypothetical protein